MIAFTQVDNPRMVQAFIDYMRTQHIDVKLTQEASGGYVLWVQDDDLLPRVKQEFSEFMTDPDQDKYHAASWQVEPSHSPTFQYPSGDLKARFLSQLGPFTALTLFTCVLVFVLQSMGYQNQVFELLHFPMGAWQYQEIWRFITHAIMHFSVAHIAFNLIWWWQLGGDVENKLGTFKLLSVAIISAVISGGAQFWFNDASFGGLSGVVYGLVGYVWIMGVKKPEKGLALANPVFGFMLIWLIVGFVQPFLPVANSAHVGGLIAGLLLGAFDAIRR